MSLLPTMRMRYAPTPFACHTDTESKGPEKRERDRYRDREREIHTDTDRRMLLDMVDDILQCFDPLLHLSGLRLGGGESARHAYVV